MHPVRLSGQEFAALLGSGAAHERLVDAGSSLVLVDGDDRPDRVDDRAMGRLVTLAAVVVAVADPSVPPPEWADLVVAPDSPELDRTLATVGTNPMAATTLALLLRGGSRRSLLDGLVAESVTYGLLQGGPEFGLWRSSRSVHHRSPGAGEPVLVTRHDGRLSITLNRPEVRNALDWATRDGLVAALSVAAADPSVTEVVLSGAGPAFCAGGDLDEFGSRPDPVTAHLTRLQRHPARALAEVSDRVTARIHGSTIGSGIELAAFAHRVVARADTRIALPEVGLGLVPGAGGTVSLPDRIGRHATMLLAVGLEGIGADTALRWGLVDHVEP